MASAAFDLAALKATKNAIIGNPSKKAEIARDGLIPLIIDQLNPVALDPSKPNTDESRIEAAHIISSLSYGSRAALKSLLHGHLHHALLYALSNIQPTYSGGLVSALTRALKTFATSLADIVGPPLWGLHAEETEIIADSVNALEEIFQVPSLDIWLPFLVSNSVPVSVSIVWIIASCVRGQRHRVAVTQWLPLPDRSKETKGKRGWERPDVGKSNAPERGGGWLVRNLTEFIGRKDFKVQEAALYALATIFKDSPSVVLAVKNSGEKDVLATTISLTRSRNTDVELAASLCATHLIRASPPPSSGPHGSPPSYDGSPVLTVIHALNHLIDSEASPLAQTKACYIIASLTRDEKEIERIAVEVGSLDKIIKLMLQITSQDKSEWDEDEPEATVRLREAILMAIATLNLHWDGIRRDLSSNPTFSGILHRCMSHPSVGVRYAACQCARTLCRSVSVLRTSVADSGLSDTLFDLVKNLEEDTRVRVAALMVICNLLNEFSPVRVMLLEQGVITSIVKLVHSENPDMRLNALWAIKNALFNATPKEKHMIMDELGWDFLATLLLDYDQDVREQAVSVVRNLSVKDADIVFEGLGTFRLANCIESALSSSNEGLVTQALLAIANLSQGSDEHLTILITPRPGLLDNIRDSLHHPKIGVQRAATMCVLKLAQRNVRELQEAGIETTLRNMSSGGPTPLAGSDDREIMDRVRKILGIIQEASRLSNFG